MGVAKICFDVLNDSKLDTSMVKVVCKQCLKDSCPLQIKKHLIEIKRDITNKYIYRCFISYSMVQHGKYTMYND